MNIEQFNPKYPYKIKVEVDWPITIEYNGKTYWFSNSGSKISNGMPCARYYDLDNIDVVWLDIDGTMSKG